MATIQPVHKHVKLSEKSSDDRMRKLPEPILHHIHSFLSTQEAATTSVLSKSWQYQWTWVPDLDINQREMSANHMSFFGRIILKIFLSRRAWCIRKLSLSSCMASDFDLISICSILCAAVELNVEELDLCIYKFFKLPTSLFCCKTLVVLKLRDEIMIDIGSSVHLPSLKVLHLERVKYKDGDTFRSLFSGCPVLDYLVVGFVPHNDFHYEISSLSVRHIILLQVCFNPYLPPKITVSAPALEHFTIDVAPTVLVLNNVPSLVHVKFNIYLLGVRLRDKYWDTIKVVFGALCNVQFLELNFEYSEVQSDHNIPIAIFPRFENLVQLKLVSDRCSLPLVLNILINCSRLEHLTLVSKMTICGQCEKPQCWISPQHVPHCLALHLTAVKFDGFEGFEGEIEFAKYVLNNSKVLRSLKIRYENNTNLERKFGAYQKICESVKEATKCQLTFQQQHG